METRVDLSLWEPLQFSVSSRIHSESLMKSSSMITITFKLNTNSNWVCLSVTYKCGSWLVSSKSLWNWSVAYILRDTTLFAHSYGIWLTCNGWGGGLSFDELIFFWAFHLTGIFFIFILLLKGKVHFRLNMPFFWLVMDAKRSFGLRRLCNTCIHLKSLLNILMPRYQLSFTWTTNVMRWH